MRTTPTPTVPFTAAPDRRLPTGPVSAASPGEGKGTTSEAAIRRRDRRRSRALQRPRDPPRSLSTSLPSISTVTLQIPAGLFSTTAPVLVQGFPFAPFDPEADLDWTRGVWLDTGEPVQLPALATLHALSGRARARAVCADRPATASPPGPRSRTRALARPLRADRARRVHALLARPATGRCGSPRSGCDPGHPCGRSREVERLGARTELYLLDAGTRRPTDRRALASATAAPGRASPSGSRPHADAATSPCSGLCSSTGTTAPTSAA